MEIQEQRTRAERADRNLMSSQKQDEYTAAIREADAARKQISAFETQVLEQMETFEQAEKDLAERAPEVEKLGAEMAERFAAFDEQTKTQADEVSAYRAERERLLNALPKSMSSMYNRISARIRGGVAMAEARNGACTACLMTLRPQVMAQVRRGEEVITCDNCNRILYFAPADQVQPMVPTSAQPKAATHWIVRLTQDILKKKKGARVTRAPFSF